MYLDTVCTSFACAFIFLMQRQACPFGGHSEKLEIFTGARWDRGGCGGAR